MKKFVVTIFVLFSIFMCTSVWADDVDVPATGDLWDNWSSPKDFYGQDKPVTDEDFDKAVEQVKDKQNRNWFGLKKRNKNIPKGEEFSQSNETEIINSNADKDSLPVISLPVELKVGDDILPVGHYQIKAEKENGNTVIKFYQAQYVMAQVPAQETSDDFGEEAILFAKWVPENDNQIKLIFGSMDINAYALIDIAK